MLNVFELKHVRVEREREREMEIRREKNAKRIEEQEEKQRLGTVAQWRNFKFWEGKLIH